MQEKVKVVYVVSQLIEFVEVGSPEVSLDSKLKMLHRLLFQDRAVNGACPQQDVVPGLLHEQMPQLRMVAESVKGAGAGLQVLQQQSVAGVERGYRTEIVRREGCDPEPSADWGWTRAEDRRRRRPGRPVGRAATMVTPPSWKEGGSCKNRFAPLEQASEQPKTERRPPALAKAEAPQARQQKRRESSSAPAQSQPARAATGQEKVLFSQSESQPEERGPVRREQLQQQKQWRAKRGCVKERATHSKAGGGGARQSETIPGEEQVSSPRCSTPRGRDLSVGEQCSISPTDQNGE